MVGGTRVMEGRGQLMGACVLVRVHTCLPVCVHMSVSQAEEGGKDQGGGDSCRLVLGRSG